MSDKFVWNELHSKDPEKARKFFSGLFDWVLEDKKMGDLDYTFIHADGKLAGGIMSQMVPGASSAWLTYIQVEDLEAKSALAKELGATLLVENQQAGDLGTFTVVKEPTGSVFALWKPNR